MKNLSICTINLENDSFNIKLLISQNRNSYLMGVNSLSLLSYLIAQ